MPREEALRRVHAAPEPGKGGQGAGGVPAAGCGAVVIYRVLQPGVHRFTHRSLCCG